MAGANLFKHLKNEGKIVCLDTETTGLSLESEACQISVITLNERELFCNLIRPIGDISPEASKVHGIYAADVANSHDIDYHWRFISGKHVLGNKMIIGYNVMFDIRILNQSMRAVIGEGRFFQIAPLMIFDVMTMYTEFYGTPGKKWLKLKDACIKEGIEIDEKRLHDAVYDTILTCRLFKRMFLNE